MQQKLALPVSLKSRPMAAGAFENENSGTAYPLLPESGMHGESKLRDDQLQLRSSGQPDVFFLFLEHSCI